MEKLKLCPFCGWGTIVDGGFLNHKCTCNSCGASTKGYPTWEMAVESWNRRPGEADAQQWIPCSEEMPEPNRSVLVQLSDDFVDPIQIMTLNISKCEGDFFYFWRTQEMGINFDMGDVVAWQPIPESWKGAQDGGET